MLLTVITLKSQLELCILEQLKVFTYIILFFISFGSLSVSVFFSFLWSFSIHLLIHVYLVLCLGSLSVSSYLISAVSHLHSLLPSCLSFLILLFCFLFSLIPLGSNRNSLKFGPNFLRLSLHFSALISCCTRASQLLQLSQHLKGGRIQRAGCLFN